MKEGQSVQVQEGQVDPIQWYAADMHRVSNTMTEKQDGGESEPQLGVAVSQTLRSYSTPEIRIHFDWDACLTVLLWVSRVSCQRSGITEPADDNPLTELEGTREVVEETNASGSAGAAIWACALSPSHRVKMS